MTPSLFALLWMGAPATAQDLTIHDDWMLEPVEGTVTENGIGSPTVAYDRANDLWVMYFETRFAGPDAVCADGRWGIGRATSRDGLDWTVDAALHLTPADDTFYSCVVAHPTVMFDGTTWHLWFKAQQANGLCDDTATPAPPWGCNAVTGVGYATSTDGTAFTVPSQPSIALSSFGFPSVVAVDGVYRMLLAFSNERNNIYELWQAISTNGGASWTQPVVVIRPGFAPWGEDEIYNPAMSCRPDDPSPYLLWAGGRDTRLDAGTPTIVTAGLGRATSADGVDWTFDGNNPFVIWDLDPDPPAEPDRDWRHWDVVRIGDDSLLYFSQRNDDNVNRVGLAYTYATQQTAFAEFRISDRICVSGEDTAIPHTDPGDTESPTDTDDTESPVDTDTDTDTDGKDDDGCPGCATGGPGTGGMALGLLALATLRRRRH